MACHTINMMPNTILTSHKSIRGTFVVPSMAMGITIKIIALIQSPKKSYKSRAFGFSPLPFTKVEVLTCDLYSNSHDKICLDLIAIFFKKLGNNCLNVFFPIPCCSLSYKNGDYPYRVLLGNTITVLFIGRSRRIEFPKEETKEVEAFTLEEVGETMAYPCGDRGCPIYRLLARQDRGTQMGEH